MPSITGFQFNERDAEIVHYVYLLRVATLDHLAALTNRSYKTLERRVPKLRNERYLRRLKPRPHKGLYVIGPEGVHVLIEGGYAPEDLAAKRLRENEWKDLTIPHALHVADIHERLLILSRQSPIRTALWRHDGPELWDSVSTREDGKLPVRPDAYFVLQHSERPTGKNKLHFFLEADVGTMSHARIAQKIKAYAAYHQQQRHVAKYGITYFQVVIVTQTRARAENLKAELHPMMSAAQRRAYHFIPLEELTLDALLASVEKHAA
jgi:Replication-relaxation